MSRRVALMVGPSSGRGGADVTAAELRHWLETDGDEVRLVGGTSREEAVRLARAAVAHGVDALVVVGGDGTVHLALQAVAGTSTPLAILPTGTGNDLATCLGVPADPNETARDIHNLAVRPAVPVDAVQVGDSWFACVLGTGFDAAVNERANRMRWPRGRRKYDLATLLTLRTYQPQDVVLTLDGVRHEARVMLVALGNARSYGGGMKVCPDADLTDGLLDVVIVGPLSRRRFVRLFPSVFKGTHVRDRAVLVHRAREVVLEGPPLAVYADGEPFGRLPLTCRVVPGALRVIGAHVGT